MKTENEKIKGLFGTNMEAHHKSEPDFESMWKEAENSSKRQTRFVWRIAASIALLLAAGAAVVLNQRGDTNHPNNSIQIESWTEPTKSLIGAQSGSSLTVLTEWTSPTEFLIPQSNQHIK